VKGHHVVLVQCSVEERGAVAILADRRLEISAARESLSEKVLFPNN